MSDPFLDTSIEYLKGVGPQRATLLREELKIRTFGQLMRFYPFRYVDRSRFYDIAELHGDMPSVQIRGRLAKVEKVGEKRASRLVAQFYDNTGSIELVWFKGIRWIAPTLKAGQEYVVFGKPTAFNSKLNIAHPELEPMAKFAQSLQAQLQPVYSSTEKLSARGLNSRGISKLMHTLLQQVGQQQEETLANHQLKEYNLMPRGQALRQIHFPTDHRMLQYAQVRLKFEELFYLQLQMLRAKIGRNRQIRGVVFPNVGNNFNRFYHDHLPFDLTNAQKRVIKEIRRDVGSGIQMNRLLQGDVGSGKTVVALMVMLIAIDNGFQAALMAPTEILSNQHFETVLALLDGMDIKVGLLTGSTKQKARTVLHQQLESGELNILIGTHALIEDKVKFRNLGLVVIDEQHRFGVAQRSRLWRKSAVPPHMLVMTATPIPRTLAMTLYGDLDVSVIDELPPGRKPVKTIHRFDSSRLKVFGFIQEEIAKGRQVYVVYPLIQESEKMDYKDLMDGYESISRAFPLPKYKVSIVHGKMKPKDKDHEMEKFASGKSQILVATTVIEVGVNVPNASVMVIESAERFGLSQLHQLRGRVGRGAEQSYCILLTGNKLSADGKLRMETMVKTNDGFEIAEVDLRLRGPGDIMGTQQSGMLDLSIADIAKDGQILQLARESAQNVLRADPDLKLPEHQRIAKWYARYVKIRPNWSRIS